MDDVVTVQLGEIIARYGKDIAADPRRIGAFLSDLASGHRREIFILTSAAREGVPAGLLAADRGVPVLLVAGRLSQLLQDNLGLAPDAAEWAVCAWASALGISGVEASAFVARDSPPEHDPGGPAVSVGPAAPGAPEPTVLVVAPLGAAHHRTITDAIAAAEPGARILVRPGVYSDPLRIDKSVELVADGPLADVVIETAAGCCVVMKAGYGTIRGFTIRKRKGSDDYAMEIPLGRVVIEGCDISSESRSCVAISGQGTAPVLRACKIHHGHQGGIVVKGQAQAVIEDCDIFANTMIGVEIGQGADPALRRCSITGGKSAGVLVCSDGRGILEDCEIRGNAICGVQTMTGGDPVIRNCRVHGQLQVGVLVIDQGRGTVVDTDICGSKFAGVQVTHRGKVVVRGSRIRDGLESGLYTRAGGGAIVEDSEFTGNAEPAIRVGPGSGHVEVSGCRIEETPAALRMLQNPDPPVIPGSDAAKARITQLLADAERAFKAMPPGTAPDPRKVPARRKQSDRRSKPGVRSTGVVRAYFGAEAHWLSKRSALRAVATAMARTDPDGAERLARSVADSAGRADALAAVAVGLAGTDPGRAERLIRLARDEDGKAHGLGQLARALADTAPEHAERLAASITDRLTRDEALEALAAAAADRDPDRAERLTRAITDIEIRDQALLQAALRAPGDPGRGERLAGLVTDPDTQADILYSLVTSLADTDTDRAERLAGLISDQVPGKKATALSSVAVALASRQHRRAARLARTADRLAASIKDPCSRAVALADIAAARVNSDPDHAERIARWISRSAAELAESQ